MGKRCCPSFFHSRHAANFRNLRCSDVAAAEPSTLPTPATTSQEAAVPRREIGLREAMSLIVGLVIGAGIFKAPSMVASSAGGVEWMFVAWILGGIISLIGALCYAELATTYP